MFVRHFEAATFSRIESIAPPVSGAVTMLALVKPDDVAGIYPLLSMENADGTTVGYGLWLGTFGAAGQISFSVGAPGSDSRESDAGLVAPAAWQLVAVTKAAGSVAPRFHHYRFDTLTWTHADAASAIGDAAAIVEADSLHLGHQHSNGNYYEGDYAFGAVWAEALTDAQLEGLVVGNAASLLEVGELDPAWFGVLSQPDESWPVVDLSRHGRDQDLFNGTTVVEAMPPVRDPEAADLIFNGSFNGGTKRRWYSDDQLEGATAALALGNTFPSPPLGETHFGEFTLDTGDTRSELAAFAELHEGTTAWFRFQTYLQSPFPAEDEWQLIWQLHTAGAFSPSLAIEVNRYEADGVPRFWLHNNREQVDGGANETIWYEPLIEDEWIDFVMRVDLSSDPELGALELWVNGEQQRLGANGETTEFRGSTLVDEYGYLKIGYYRNPIIVGEGVVRTAGFKVGATAESVGFEPPPPPPPGLGDFPALSHTGERLYDALAPLTGDDVQHGYALGHFCNGLARLLDSIADVSRDEEERPGWAVALDPDDSPVLFLPWLGQFVGVRLPEGLVEDEARDRIRAREGFRRGSPGALIQAAQAELTGTQTVILTERQGSAYAFAVATFADETPHPERVEQALLRQKPGGLVMTYTVIDGGTFLTLRDTHTDFADVAATFADFDEVRANPSKL